MLQSIFATTRYETILSPIFEDLAQRFGVIIYGVGNEGEKFIKYFMNEHSNLKIICLVDKSSILQKEGWNGKEIISPIYIEKYDTRTPIIITSIDYRQEISESLYALGFENQFLHLPYLTGRDLPERIFRNAKVLPNRNAFLKYLVKEGIAAEVGVAYGDFSKLIIEETDPALFYAIDTFGISPENPMWGRMDFKDSRLTHIEYFKARFASEILSGKVQIKQGMSWEVLSEFADNYFDFLYLDTDHAYGVTVKEINVAYKKIKDGGIIAFNDYAVCNPNGLSYYGVKAAVDEFLLYGKHEILFVCLQAHGLYDIVLRIHKK